MEKKEIVEKYLSDFPNLPNRTLASKIYKDYPLAFKDIETVRAQIRYYKGSIGKKNLNNMTKTKYLALENREKKYDLPKSIETVYKPYQIIGNKGLIFGDSHIPFHSITALETMFDYTMGMDLDFILIGGDFMDCFELSYFNHEPNLIQFKDERDMAKNFLKELKNIYPKARIYYKFGNHEKRFESYLMDKAAEIFGLPEFRLEVILGLYDLGIEYIPEEIYIDISGLSILHGHEYKNAVSSPANPARTYYLRTKSCSVGLHYHQTSEHTEPAINGEVATCWSVGCSCELHPKYMPLNKWNHGFALYTQEDDNFWTIQNKRIIGNRVV